MSRCFLNEKAEAEPFWKESELFFLESIRSQTQRRFHEMIPGYEKTPLRECKKLAADLGLGSLLVKDESSRYGINAFKGLGASWAIYSWLCEDWKNKTGENLPLSLFEDAKLKDRLGKHTFSAATDGNHGRAVAWTARMLGQEAVIFMPFDAASSRIENIEKEGARVELIEGTFDDCVRACEKTSQQNGWCTISDTAYPGNMTIPGHIITGYSTIFAEIIEQAKTNIDIVFLPAGVGGLAAAATAYMVQRFEKNRPKLVCIEPEECACFLESAMHGKAITASGNHHSIMVGLCCATPSLLAWPIIRDGMDLFLSIEDEYAMAAMRAYSKEGIVSGESGASSLAGLMALLNSEDLEKARKSLALNKDTVVLVINTEGATDPENYERVIAFK